MRVFSKLASLAAMTALLATTGLVAAASSAQAAYLSHQPDANGDYAPADAWSPSNVELYAPGGVERFLELEEEDGS